MPIAVRFLENIDNELAEKTPLGPKFSTEAGPFSKSNRSMNLDSLSVK